MKRRAAIRLLREAARRGRLVFSTHALDEMDAEGETRESVATALRQARSFTLQRTAAGASMVRS
jgi:predicted S18 family serine protease